jgi:cytoskeletal protein RodZ
LREYNPAREAEVALMALSMDEQRVLAEIERRLSAEDPRLASCMTSFRRPGPAMAMRSPRARILGSLFTVMLVAMISLMAYAMIPFRAAHGTRTPGPSSAPGQTSLTASGNSTASVGSSAAPSSAASGSAASGSSASGSSAPGSSAPAKAGAGTHTTAAAVTGVTAHAKTVHVKTTPPVTATKAKSDGQSS